ncbi:uncharacterized protein LOC121868990 [Homarus americanus]|uniref:uncharacterized protein LOC121868990 n=1 Tax=Homarus americanus TaxID=6706 RepID=UPI001C458014|nr:uncharacterized protein LOC121868990 [Homarus americanus]
MAPNRLSFEQRKLILKWYWKSENVCDVQRQWRREFTTEPPTRLTIARIRDKFEAEGTVQNMHKNRSGRRRSSTGEENAALVLQAFTQSPQKSVRHTARETGTSRASVYRILKTAPKWKSFLPQLLHSLSEDDSRRRVEFCEWIQGKVNEDKQFVDKIVWSNEATFKLNGTVNRYNCVYRSLENPKSQVDKEDNVPGLTVWCGVSSKGIVGPFFFEGTATDAGYFNMLQSSIVPTIHQLYGDKKVYYQQDGAPPHFHSDIRDCLDTNFPGRWIGRTGNVDYPPLSPDLTPLDFYLWGNLKNTVYAKKPSTLQELRHEIEWSCTAIPALICPKVCRSVFRRCQQCLDAKGGQFEHAVYDSEQCDKPLFH